MLMTEQRQHEMYQRNTYRNNYSYVFYVSMHLRYYPCKIKNVKVQVSTILYLRSVGGVLDFPYLGLEPIDGSTTKVCDTQPVRRQTYNYLPGHRK